MMGLLRDFLSIGKPREAAESQWYEIMVVRRKLMELERRMRFSEQRRYTLRPSSFVGVSSPPPSQERVDP